MELPKQDISPLQPKQDNSPLQQNYDTINQINKISFPQTKQEFVENISKIITNFMNPFIKSVSREERKEMKQLGMDMQSPQIAELPVKPKYNLPIPTAYSTQEKKTDEDNTYYKKNISKLQANEHSQSTQISKTKLIKKPPITSQKQQIVELEKDPSNYEIKNNRIYLQGMPKKPVSSFFFFYKYYSRQLNGTGFSVQGQKITEPGPYGSDLAKKISQKWKQMTPQQKLPFMTMAQQTKDKYRIDMNSFKQLNKSSFLKIKKKRLQRARYLRKLKKNRQEGIQQPLEVKPVPPLIRPAQKYKKSQVKQTQKKVQNKTEKTHSTHTAVCQQKKKIVQKKAKNEHKPRAPVPSFFFYYKVIKQSIGKQYNIKIGSQIAKIASSKWKLMTQQEKQPYQVLARQKRQQYHDEMIKFRQQYPEQAQKMKRQKVQMMEEKKNKKKQKQKVQKQQSLINSQSQNNGSDDQVDSLDGEITKGKIHKSEKKKYDEKPKQIIKEKVYEQKKQSYSHHQGKSHRPKAPISSFFMFFKQNNVLLADQFKESFGAKLVKYASQIWRNMSEDQKKPYQQKSQVTRNEYYQAMNQYKKKYPEQIKQRKIQLKKMKLQKVKKAASEERQKLLKKQEENSSQQKQEIQNSQSVKQNDSSL